MYYWEIYTCSNKNYFSESTNARRSEDKFDRRLYATSNDPTNADYNSNTRRRSSKYFYIKTTFTKKYKNHSVHYRFFQNILKIFQISKKIVSLRSSLRMSLEMLQLFASSAIYWLDICERIQKIQSLLLPN
jgi:hypothetical protein